jgi:hypothetical protein
MTGIRYMRQSLADGQGLPRYSVFLRQPGNKIESYLSLSDEPAFINLRPGQLAEFALSVEKYIFLESPSFSCSADSSASLERYEVGSALVLVFDNETTRHDSSNSFPR